MKALPLLGVTLLLAAACGHASSPPAAESAAATPNAGAASAASSAANAGARGPEEEAFAHVLEAYLYGYPLVLTDVTRRVMTNVAAPEASGRAPMNQFGHRRELPGPASKDVVSPNADTLYSIAWVDVAAEPVVLHVPDTEGRYYLLPMLDAWTNVFASPGSRTTGTAAGHFAIVGPHWKGALPAGVREIRAPTTTVWIIGRIEAHGKGDYPAVHALQNQLTLVPLHGFGKKVAASAKNFVDPILDMRTPPPVQVERMEPGEFLARLSALLDVNGVPAADSPMVPRLASLGIRVGEKLDPERLDPAVARGIARGFPAAKNALAAATKILGRAQAGWHVQRGLGAYGTEYAKRAAVAKMGLGANLSEDAIYAFAEEDSEHRPLTGKERYTLHFAAGQQPPVNAFWSVTMYDPDHFFVPNPMQRYAIGSHDAIVPSPDGSIDIYIQHEAPRGHEEHWLPAPAGPFNLILRMYWPKADALDGRWQPPGVRRLF